MSDSPPSSSKGAPSPPPALPGVWGGLGAEARQHMAGVPHVSSLPYFKTWSHVRGGEHPGVNPSWMAESCGVKLIVGTAAGYGMGIAFGMFLGAMGGDTPLQLVNGREVPQAPLREQMRAAYKSTADRSVRMGRNFASFSALFMGTECVIEKLRGKHDVMNPVYSGCATGALLGLKQGPQAACVGCVGLAAFSAVMDTFMGH